MNGGVRRGIDTGKRQTRPLLARSCPGWKSEKFIAPNYISERIEKSFEYAVPGLRRLAVTPEQIKVRK